MNDKTLEALTALAAKLGTTSEYLWGVLIKQAPLSGAIDLVVFAAWAAGCWWLLTTVRRNAEDMDELNRSFSWLGVILVVGLSALAIGMNITESVTAIFNPEYWALKQVLRSL